MRLLAATTLLALCAVGCADARYLQQFELDDRSFDRDAMAMIARDTGIHLPKGSRGLNLKYKPPVDPAFIARVEIPQSDRDAVIKQIELIQSADVGSRGVSLWAGVKWWPPPGHGVVIERVGLPSGNVVRACLVEEEGQLILYVEFVVC